MSKSQDRKTIHSRTVILPLAESGEVIRDHVEASAYFEELRQNGSSIPDHLAELAQRLTIEALAEVGDRLPELLIRGIIIRSVRAGGAQVVSDTGEAALAIQEVRQLFEPVAPVPPTEAA